MSNTTETTDRHVIDAYAVALDVTGNFQIDPKHRPLIQAIRSVYLFDRNQRTHLCELTPSYFLIHLYDQVILTNAGNALDDHAKDDLYQKYEFTGKEDIYVHCHTIDRIIAEDKPYTVDHYGDCELNHREDEIADLEERHTAEMEHIEEYLCGNCPF